MTVIQSLIVVLLSVALIIVIALVAGSLLSLDWQHGHRSRTAELPLLGGSTREGLVRIAANGMEFRARVAGLDNAGPGVVLLHGFPETSAMWEPLITALAARGYRVVAFDQRGYSPGARPDDVHAYSIPRLVEDVFAVADAIGMRQFHLVGHDWGAGVGWAAALGRGESLRSYTSLSIPHVAAFADALKRDPDQRRRSRYMVLFRTPWLPEVLFTFNRLALMNNVLYRPMSEVQRSEYNTVFAEPGALTAALNWYRANDSFAVDVAPKIRLPVLFIWGNEDPAVGRAGVTAQREFIDGPFESHELNAGHWLMEEATDRVVTTILDFLQRIDSRQEAP